MRGACGRIAFPLVLLADHVWPRLCTGVSLCVPFGFSLHCLLLVCVFHFPSFLVRIACYIFFPFFPSSPLFSALHLFAVVSPVLRTVALLLLLLRLPLAIATTTIPDLCVCGYIHTHPPTHTHTHIYVDIHPRRTFSSRSLFLICLLCLLLCPLWCCSPRGHPYPPPPYPSTHVLHPHTSIEVAATLEARAAGGTIRKRRSAAVECCWRIGVAVADVCAPLFLCLCYFGSPLSHFALLP